MSKSPPTTNNPNTTSVSRVGSRRRRRFIGGLGIGAFAAAQASAAELLAPLKAEPWSTTPGAPILEHPYGVPSSFEKDVVRRTAKAWPLPGAASSMTPLADLHGSITPNGLVYERHHAGVPGIDPAQHRLAVHGLVGAPTLFTMDDILRLPSESRIHFIECSGNTGGEWNGPSGMPVQLTHGLLSCCEWTGVRLSTLLDEVNGVQGKARWILAEGSDAAAMTRSLPLDRILDRAMIVYAQNGERLRPKNGYPLRLIVPGFEGNTHVKWLRRLKMVDAPLETREETSKYTNLLADGSARQFVFEMDAKSVITRPSPGRKLTTHGYYQISGLARDDPAREVSTDGGASWCNARMETSPRERALTRLEADWQWNGGPAAILSRATDSTGYVQPTREALVSARGLILAISGLPLLANASHHLGTPLTEEQIAPWDIDVGPDGRGLPAGSGDVAMGAHVFASKSAACHGAAGQGLIGDTLVGGRGTLASNKPKRTVGSYWPYATTLFDYIRRAMPFNAPQSLSADEVYARLCQVDGRRLPLWIKRSYPYQMALSVSAVTVQRCHVAKRSLSTAR